MSVSQTSIYEDDSRIQSRKYSAIAENVKSTSVIEFIVGFSIVADGTIAPGLHFPISLLGILALLLVSTWRKNRWDLGVYAKYFIVMVLCVLWVVLVSATSTYLDADNDWIKRGIRIAAIVLLAFYASDGRVNVNSVLRGFIFGLIVNIFLHYSGVTYRHYGELLTGLLGDKNKAGLYYCIGAMFVFSVFKNKSARITFSVIFAVALWLTGSRTSLTAYAVGLVWLFWGSRLSMVGRTALAGVLVYVIGYVEENFARVGEFADREGSDFLRSRIDAASTMKVHSAPFQGMGLGEARVYLIGDNAKQWFFHNSYQTLWVEGGYLYMLIVVATTVLIAAGVFAGVKHTWEMRVAESAAAALMVCAWKLGEVFLTPAWLLVVMFAISKTQESRYLLDQNADADNSYLRYD